MSLTDLFAEPMLDGNKYLQKYKDQLIELDKKGLLPKLDKTLSPIKFTHFVEAKSERTNRLSLP